MDRLASLLTEINPGYCPLLARSGQWTKRCFAQSSIPPTQTHWYGSSSA